MTQDKERAKQRVARRVDLAIESMFEVVLDEGEGLTYGELIDEVGKFSSDLGDMFTNWLSEGDEYELDEVIS